MDTSSGTHRAITKRCTKHWSEKGRAEGSMNAELGMRNSECAAQNTDF